MTDLMVWVNQAKATPDIHPLMVAVLFHHEFTAIHPFDDGNGRMARLLSNLILIQSGYPPVVIKQENKNEYYSVLSQADAGSLVPVVDYFGELLVHSLEVYLRGAKGENIEEAGDIDKEITLFKASFSEKYKERAGLNAENLKTTLENSISLILKELKKKLVEFDDMFVRHNSLLRLPGNTISFSTNSILNDSFSGDFEKERDEIMRYFLGNIQSNNRLIAFQYLHIWYGFRMEEIPFNHAFRLSFSFEENKYSIYLNDNQREFVSFFYNQIPGDINIKSLVNECAKQILSEIKQKANEP